MTRRLMTFILLVALILLPSALLFAANSQEVSEAFDNGWIDWSNGTVWVDGIHTPKTRVRLRASSEAREYYINRAVHDAKAKLSQMLQKLTVHAETTGEDIIGTDNEIRAQIDLMFLSTPVTEKRFLTDGSVEVTLRFPLKGAFSQLILPQEIRQIDPIIPLFPSPPREEVEHRVSYTGLIVDARGIDTAPCLAPRVVSESGEEVYGPTIISREYAVQRGVTTYEKNLTRAGQGLFAGENPLMVTGIGTTARAQTDIIISNEDAARIRSDAGHTTFLSQCRVVIVIDAPPSRKKRRRRHQ